MKKTELSRREMLAGAAAVVATGAISVDAAEDEPYTATKKNLKQAACKWCMGNIPFETLCQHVSRLGLYGIDLVGPEEWPILKKHNLICTITPSHGIGKGLNRSENHDECLASIRKGIEQTAEAGFPNVICFSGNRDGMADDEGLKNCEAGIKKIIAFAEEKKVNLVMELLNSKRNHKDYMCDHSQWGAELAKRVGSERFGLLYDIYHMQIQEGDIIDSIRECKNYIKHFHTGGVPGRGPLHLDQELNYPPIIKAIIATGYKGYLAHEFVASGDEKQRIDQLTQAVKLCDQ